MKAMPYFNAQRIVGAWFLTKYRKAAAERGHFAVAVQLRKQGVPLSVARVLLGVAP